MRKGSIEDYERKKDLVALFKEQVAILKELMPPPFAAQLNAINVVRYDALLASGPSEPWPKGVLSGLEQGIRDFEVMLKMLPADKRTALRERLRNASHGAVDDIRAQDASRLATVRQRGRILSDDELYLLRAEIDKLEASPIRDEALLHDLYRLVDEAS